MGLKIKVSQPRRRTVCMVIRRILAKESGSLCAQEEEDYHASRGRNEC